MKPRKFYNYSSKNFLACIFRCRESLIEVIIVKLKNSQRFLNIVTSDKSLNLIKRYQPVGSASQDYMIKNINMSIEIRLVKFFTSCHFLSNLASDVLFSVFLYFFIWKEIGNSGCKCRNHTSLLQMSYLNKHIFCIFAFLV